MLAVVQRLGPVLQMDCLRVRVLLMVYAVLVLVLVYMLRIGQLHRKRPGAWSWLAPSSWLAASPAAPWPRQPSKRAPRPPVGRQYAL